MNQFDDQKMMLSELLAGIAQVPSDKDVQLTGISEYSLDVQAGDVFIALSNLHYSQEAISNGAVAIIYPSGLGIDQAHIDSVLPYIACENLSVLVNDIIKRFYGDAASQIETIAITGTDGKSSVAHLVTQALEISGDACGLIGTLGYGRLNNLTEATHTTPPRSRLAREYTRLNNMGCKVVALEASSHGIEQCRLHDLNIHTAVLTNITRDHLDYHKTLENYIQAKAALFFEHDAKVAVINLDDEIGQQWCEQLSVSLDVVSYSLTNPNANVYASSIEYLSASTSVCIHINGAKVNVHTALLGEFNVLNLLAVAAVLVSLQKSNEQIAIALNEIDAVPGRMQRVESDKNTNVIVDYAHTPAALLAAINAVRQHCCGKLICVFGCGGDRDEGKRSQMGEVASQYCDYVVITSDNPRNESAEIIIQAIKQGCVSNSQCKSIVDRKEAIIHALEIADDGDAVLIAGKGHEKHQYIGNQIIEFDDVDVAKNVLQRMTHG